MKLLLQKDLFWEDEFNDTEAIIRKYFPNTEVVTEEDITFSNVPINYTGSFRGSLALGRRLNRVPKWADAIHWAPNFKHCLANPQYYFLDAYSLFTQTALEWPLFIRPTAGSKIFSGNVYTEETFKNEFNFFVNNKNEDPYTLCMFCSPEFINKEWRIIFISGEYCSGSQYMVNGKLDVNSEVPESVINFAKKLAEDNFFINKFEFVIDIGLTLGGLVMIEVNGFETASFYGADLDKIYKTWSESLK